jgi:hypothetical protein
MLMNNQIIKECTTLPLTVREKNEAEQMCEE